MIKFDKAATSNSRHAMSLPLEPLTADSERGKPEAVSVLVFEVGDAFYAIGVEQTEGVVDCPRITPLPSAPDGVAGLTSVRGRMTLVMDLGSKAGEQTIVRRLILVKGDAQLGLLADRVEGVVGLEPKKVRSVQNVRGVKFPWPANGYFKRGKRRVPIVDVERLAEA
jgi:purine-binding chemotaxis protein CheW